jgi:hypothetical protein
MTAASVFILLKTLAFRLVSSFLQLLSRLYIAVLEVFDSTSLFTCRLMYIEPS